MELPECPVCMETMSSPIFQCQSGHSLCNSCTNTLCPPICPICRQPMTQMRNWQLEDIIAKVICKIFLLLITSDVSLYVCKTLSGGKDCKNILIYVFKADFLVQKTTQIQDDTKERRIHIRKNEFEYCKIVISMTIYIYY